MVDMWYDLTGPEEPLTQGDIIFDCPVLIWKDEPFGDGEDDDLDEQLRARSDCERADTVVLTQACDLAQNKVINVTLCVHYALHEWETIWREKMVAIGQNPSEKAWKSKCEDIRN